eukprot:gene23650-30668_t
MTLGRTGDGKSSFCNLFVQMMENLPSIPTIFEERDSALSCTYTINERKIDVSNTVIIDSPGLLDTSGNTQDEVNLNVIVQHARSSKIVSAFLLIMNEQVIRFDGGMQKSFKILYDSFGPKLLNNLGIVFTRSFSGKTAQDSQKVVRDSIIPKINELIGSNLSHIPSWQVDCHPENFSSIASPMFIGALSARNKTAIHEIQRWAQSLASVDTSSVSKGQYESIKKLKELEIKRIEAQRRLEEENRKTAAAKAALLA